MTAFDDAFADTCKFEGGFQEDPEDRGNWTGGQKGVGSLNGTKYGISAASYPSLDIVNLTLDDAKAIYKRDYWDRIGGDDLPPVLAAEAFDAAVNHGVGRVPNWMREAIRAAQEAAGIAVDGVMGPQTKAAMERREIARIAAIEFLAQRTRFFIAEIPDAAARRYGLGWARRLIQRTAAIGPA